MRVLCRILELEPSQDGEGKPVCHVTLKFAEENRQNSLKIITLKEGHLKAGVNRQLEGFIGRPVLLNVGLMLSDRKELIWFFPPHERGGVKPELFNDLGFDVDHETGEVLKPSSSSDSGKGTDTGNVVGSDIASRFKK